MEKKDEMLDLLKVNYNNLHESMWNNHRVSWIVTSIFIPVLFAMLGYLVREYDAITRTQALMGFFVVESLLVTWLLIMLSFKHYNDVRRKKLREIENLFNKKVFNEFNLFILNPDYKPELKKGKVNKRLIEVFDQNAISLSSNSEIYEFPKQKTWKIEDGRESYIIKEVDKQLKVYETDFSQYNLKYRQDPKQFVFLPMVRFRLSFMMIYYWLSGIYTALNIGLLVAKFNY
ncbi:hypothetical protein KAR91_60815 [Candidatus Pacearchaeota archaeon]|nr:hypothetical protein [Candidatus Pacearchaeota archaeon]